MSHGRNLYPTEASSILGQPRPRSKWDVGVLTDEWRKDRNLRKRARKVLAK